MDIYNLFALIAAAFTGATMGSFVLITLLYNTLLKSTNNIELPLFIYRRFYRLNSFFCLLAGICAALIKNQTATFLLIILAVSYVFTHSHILQGLLKSCDEQFQVHNLRTNRSLTNLQNLLHLCQFFGAGYAIYLLALTK